MSDQHSSTPSKSSSDGAGASMPDAMVVKQEQKLSANPKLLDGNCRFINRYNGRCTVSVWYTTGGVSNATLQNQGDYWDLRVRDGDCYCWDHNGACNANCSLRCSPGGTYYVG